MQPSLASKICKRCIRNPCLCVTMLLGFVRVWTVKVRSFHCSVETCNIFSWNTKVEKYKSCWLVTDHRKIIPLLTIHTDSWTHPACYSVATGGGFWRYIFLGARSCSLTPTHNVDVKSERRYISASLYAFMTRTLTNFLYKTCCLAVKMFHLLLIEPTQRYATN
jgi:hypothetical protein